MGVDPRGAGASRRRLLVLGAGPAQLGLLRAARTRGLSVVVCDRDAGALGLRLADRHALVSVEDEAGVEEVARSEAVDGLIAPGTDFPVLVAARVAARLGLAHPLPPEVAAAAVSKALQREAFARAGVPQPAWRAVTAAEDDVTLPAVVKPPDRQGQVAVSLVRAREELAPAVEAAVAASRNGSALVEELVEGPEVTVNAFSREGDFRVLTVTDRITAPPPAFGVALRHVWPSAVSVDEAVEAARAAAAALGIREGPTYTQLRVGEDGPRVIELAARLGGGHDAELCEAALGIDLNALALAAALGRRAKVPVGRPAGGACVLFLVAPPGRLRRVAGVDEALRLPGVLDALPYRPPGWRFGPLRAGADRAGFVLARGDSRAQALARGEAAAERVRFHVDA
ncbi:MAG: ATP-grasp domain-containing protein [Thermoleophilia bacterium]|nr:ATP-grasp domain-containing protein [Thermoleophilia bacterium]